MNQITAKMILDSIYDENRISTLELDYPRFIHSEFMTHRLFSRNAASSRAIPAKAVRQQVWYSPALPNSWGKNQSGMQASSNLGKFRSWMASKLWCGLAKVACLFHFLLEKVGVHKQLTNRILEPWQMIKVVVTATEWDNFLWLRNHSAAQPEIHTLARKIQTALDSSVPQTLRVGQWHLPYHDPIPGEGLSYRPTKTPSLAQGKAVSVSCCAQVSYRKLDDSLEKAERIAKMLTSGDRIHASPFEHQATPIDPNTTIRADVNDQTVYMPDGVTHIDANCDAWSGNFKGWIQHRQLIKGHVK